MKRLLLALAVFSFFISYGADAASKVRKKDISSKALPIVAWYSIPPECSTIERFQELKEAGFNISFSPTNSLSDALVQLDCAEKVGIKILFNCPELKTETENVVMQVRNHPALYAYYLKDEPSIGEFPELARWADQIRSLDNNHMIYLNLFPNYGVRDISYSEYVHSFIDLVHLPMLSFDYYPVTTDGIRETWWNNLEIISTEAADADLPFWAFALSTAHFSYPNPTLASLRLQFYTDLAYGAQGLQYFTYWCPTPETGDYHDAPVDRDGNKSPQYDLLKKMNAELQARAPVFLGAKVVLVCHTGETLPPGVTELTKLPEAVTYLNTRGKGAVVSVLENGRYCYLVLVNRSLNEGIDYDIAFSKRVDVIDNNGKASIRLPRKKNTFRLGRGDCAIYRWKL